VPGSAGVDSLTGEPCGVVVAPGAFALSAMHKTVRHLAPAWPCIVSRLATPTVSARRQVCEWTAADVRRRSDRQPRQFVSVSYPATRYTANL